MKRTNKGVSAVPGKLVDVGGYQLHILSKGVGRPSIVIESGLATGSMVWGLIQPELARQTQVVTYDRAGYGWSEASLQPSSVEHMVESLHLLLINARIDGPYLLVGHSFGGLVMRLFATRYPEKVIGLVLVDALSEHLFSHAPEIYHEWSKQLGRTFRSLHLIARFGLLHMLVGLRQTRLLPELVTKQPKEQQDLLLASGFLSGRNFSTALAELPLIGPEADYASEAAPHLDIPLVVLSHGHATMFSSLPQTKAQQAEEIWQASQRALAQLSPQGQLVIAADSGHDIYIDEPELVLEAIRMIMAKSQIPLSENSDKTRCHAQNPGAHISVGRSYS